VFGRINVSTMGARSVLAVAETMNVTTERLLFGFGKLAISVQVTCDEGVSAAKDASGVIFLFFLGGVN
jgi:hypothetical protein